MTLKYTLFALTTGYLTIKENSDTLACGAHGGSLFDCYCYFYTLSQEKLAFIELSVN